MNTYRSYLSSQNSEVKEDLLRLIRAQSPSHNKLLVDQCGDLLKEIFHNRLNGKWNYKTFEQQETGNHFSFELEDGNNKPRILFLSHFDTVWDVDAIPLVEKENDIYGPGVFDMKAGLLSSIWAVRALQSELDELPFTPVYLFTADEEIGSKTSRTIIEQVAETCDAVLVMEPPVFGSNALKTERKGVGRYTLKVQGISAHAGNHHEDGVSAILELSRQIIELEKLTDYEKETTLNVGVIKGGTSSNVISAVAEAEIDFRVTSYEEAEKIIHTLENLKPFNNAAVLSISGELNRPPLEKTEANALLYQHAVAAGERVGISIEEAKAGGGSDGNFTSALGIPTLDGLGIPGDGPHAIHEHIHFDHFSERCALISEICLEVGTKEAK
ncbi:glutamate carboxypeptidase [Planomicrobium stackebrandtii]|uniref:Glutamate carboxypeptidase n=1 Tax=Planomicrobium stackebrandtii TaxID=253160 RepID=A0ABU0GRY4_9BACL|nr:M20 family metallopeptidase [Planomicrobium stackebrandtii]MDQ0428116.1 glutamate carboxypeptidase [Planomicrobium stackebrandtii]